MNPRSYGAPSFSGTAPTLASFLRDTYGPAVLVGYAPAWRVNAAAHIETLQASSLGIYPLPAIRPADVARWWAATVQAGHPRTANMLRQRLRHVFRYAIGLELVERDPTRAIGKMRENEDRVRYLTDEQRAALLAEAARTNPRIYRYVLFAMHTMGRRRSLMKLREQDVDLARGTVLFRKTKTGKDVEVPLTAPFSAEVATWLTGQADAPLLYQYPNPHAVSLAFRRVCERCNVRDFHFHDLRHDLATRLVNAGTDLIVLKALGGWETMQMVSRYAHPSDQLRRAAMERTLTPLQTRPSG
jgi:integrase